MRLNDYLKIVCIVACAVAVGCGGAEKKSAKDQMLEGVNEDVDVVAELTGIDETTPVAVEQEAANEKPAEPPPEEKNEGEDDYIGGAQGAFVARLMIEGNESPGTFTVNETVGDEAVVMKDIPTGKEIRLDPGDYDFTFVPAEVVGNPKITLRTVEIPAGRLVRREVKVPVGRITLVTGPRCAKKQIRIKQKGATEWYEGKFFTCQEMVLMSGEYEAEMGGSKRGTPISGIQVYEGGVRDVMIRPQ